MANRSHSTRNLGPCLRRPRVRCGSRLPAANRTHARSPDGYSDVRRSGCNRRCVDSREARRGIRRDVHLATMPAAGGDGGLRHRRQACSVDGAPLNSWEEFTKLIRAKPEKETLVTIRRAGADVDIRVTPRKVENLDALGQKETYGQIGIQPTIALSRSRRKSSATGTGEDSGARDAGIVDMDRAPGKGSFTYSSARFRLAAWRSDRHRAHGRRVGRDGPHQFLLFTGSSVSTWRS